MRNLLLNGQPLQTEATTLCELLTEQGFSQTSFVATAVNGKFVAKQHRQAYLLQEQDNIEIVAPMQGG